ncbi:ornithine cyclodeaminase family protein [Streptomyces sp. NPDC088801]|uniref:ornithine cyclodeaminase family protein n=1 Tax=Streptomyces sp. NPDC088801 TaxID=3365903 RepID=UPI00380EDC6F
MSAPVSLGPEDMAGSHQLLRVVDALAEAFADLSAGRVSSPPRTVVPHDGQRELLTATSVWERHGVGSVKITTLTPGNPDRGLPLIHGIVALTDLDTGRIVALLEGAGLTAVRTAAAAALATRLCAPADAADLAVLGAGAQARALVPAMAAVRPVRTVRVFSRTPERTARFARWISDTTDGRVRTVVCDTAEDAVSDAALICTATSTSGRQPLVEAGWVRPGAHVNVIGGTHEDALEVDPALLAQAFVTVEDRAAACAEAGEVRAALAGGLIDAHALHELGELVTGTAGPMGRTSVFRSVGMAIEDTAAAAALAAGART